MPEYICVDDNYLHKLELLTSNFEDLKASYLRCVAKQKKGESTKYQVSELEYEMSKAELALADFRIDNVAKNRISF